jgi:hypothetical protein
MCVPAARARRHAATQADSDRAAARVRRAHTDAERPRVRSRRDAGDHAGSAADRRRRADSFDRGGRAPVAPVDALAPVGARRTVRITGRPAAAPALARLVEVERRRPMRGPAERVGARPDRVALWAVLLAFFLILVAATSSHAATAPAAGAPPAVTAAASPSAHVAPPGRHVEPGVTAR